MASTHYRLMDEILDQWEGGQCYEEFGWAELLDSVVFVYELREHVPHRTTVARFLASRVKSNRLEVVRKKSGCRGAMYQIVPR